jgi:hypothetical protein
VTDLSTILTAAGISLPTIGTGIAFAWSKWDQAKSKTEARFVAIEGKLDECKDREDRAKERSYGLLTVIELLWQDIRGLTGGKETPAQKRARRLLDGLKLDLPPDDAELTALAMKLDNAA